MHETSCPHTPEQNGIVERKHRTLMQIGRGLMLQSRVPVEYWDEYVKMVVHLVNRIPSRIWGIKVHLRGYLEKNQITST